MKTIIITFIGCLFFSGSVQDSRLDLICRSWNQTGIKSFGKNYQSMDKSLAEIISLKKDGSFQKKLYGTLLFKDSSFLRWRVGSQINRCCHKTLNEKFERTKKNSGQELAGLRN
jgi:hypothetical protein